MKMNYPRLKAMLGIPNEISIDFSDKDLRKDLSRQIVKQIVEARRSNDDSRAAELSQAKQFLKNTMPGSCKDCGKICSKTALRCCVCWQASLQKKALAA